MQVYIRTLPSCRRPSRPPLECSPHQLYILYIRVSAQQAARRLTPCGCTFEETDRHSEKPNSTSTQQAGTKRVPKNEREAPKGASRFFIPLPSLI